MKKILIILFASLFCLSIFGCKDELKTRINFYGRGLSVEKSFDLMSPNSIKDLETRIGKVLIDKYGFREFYVRGKIHYKKCDFNELPYICNYVETIIISYHNFLVPDTTEVILHSNACYNNSGHEWDCWSGYNEPSGKVVEIMLKNVFLKLEEGEDQ